MLINGLEELPDHKRHRLDALDLVETVSCQLENGNKSSNVPPLEREDTRSSSAFAHPRHIVVSTLKQVRAQRRTGLRYLI